MPNENVDELQKQIDEKAQDTSYIDVECDELRRIFDILIEPESDSLKTTERIQDYISKYGNASVKSYLIVQYCYQLEEDQIYSFLTNVKNYIQDLDKADDLDDDYKSIANKLMEEFYSNALHNKKLHEAISLSVLDARERIDDTIRQEKANLQEETRKYFESRLEDAEKEYITILGIFAAIVVTFFGGFAFSSSVLNNIDKVSIYRLLLVTDFLAFTIVNIMYLLIDFIFIINKNKTKENKSKARFFDIKLLDIIFACIAIGIIGCWLVDARQLPKLIAANTMMRVIIGIGIGIILPTILLAGRFLIKELPNFFKEISNKICTGK